ncbi:hypothetical protein [Streptomyces sp. NPDC057686]
MDALLFEREVLSRLSPVGNEGNAEADAEGKDLVLAGSGQVVGPAGQ